MLKEDKIIAQAIYNYKKARRAQKFFNKLSVLLGPSKKVDQAKKLIDEYVSDKKVFKDLLKSEYLEKRRG